MAKNKTKKEKVSSVTDSVLAKQDNGNIQITFTVPWDKINTEKKKVIKEYAGKIDIPGFRKGNAPAKKVEERVGQNKILEHTLNHLLPELLQKAITEHKIRPAIYPKFQLVSAKEGEDWQIRAITCELPSLELGDYKNEIKGAAGSSKIWTPEKGKEDEKTKEMSNEQKQQITLQKLLSIVKTDIPKLLIEEETNARLSALLERLEKLGMNLEQYLSSRGKTAESLRKEYEQQAEETFKLDLALIKIAEEEGIKADPKEVEKLLLEVPDESKVSQKHAVEHSLRKRAALEYLVSIV